MIVVNNNSNRNSNSNNNNNDVSNVKINNHKTKPSFATIRKCALLCALHDHDMFRTS
jgi:hypothetical protein